jgi:AraC family transcriptional regulator, regulatory protein of adaptative response / methylated-DNA-[protein]-cysteine methyltransferase
MTDDPIRFTTGPSHLGEVLVARSPCGVCAIFLGDHAQELSQMLRSIFSDAQPMAHDADAAKLRAQVTGALQTPTQPWSLPLDLRGTAFQQRVWQALRAIPTGTTATYTDIAQHIGAPQSARAVAQACAANRLAVVIPCHRVVRRDGDLSGYRWGVARKRALLSQEGALLG